MLDCFFAAMVGLVVGSFLNVVITRLPHGENFLGRSRCPQCRHTLPWYDIIPIFSYFRLKGRCRYCGSSISPRYLLVEVISAILALLLWLKFPDPMLLLAYGPFLAALVALSAIDLELGLLPDAITLPGIALGLLLTALLPTLDFIDSFSGALAGAALFHGISWVYEKCTGRSGMGGGDAKLLAFIGAFLGLLSLPWVIFFSAAIGSLAGAAWALAKGQEQPGKWRFISIPFGPFLAIGALLYLLGKDQLNRF